MSNQMKSTDKIKREWGNTLTQEIVNLGNEMIHQFVQDAQMWLKEQYSNIKNASQKKQNKGLQKPDNGPRSIQKYIAVGANRKEREIRRAMKKQGYSEEEICKILVLAEKNKTAGKLPNQ